MTAEGRLVQECCDDCTGTDNCDPCDDYDPCDDPYSPPEEWDCEWGCQEQSLIAGNIHGDKWDTLQNPVTLNIHWTNSTDTDTKYKSFDFCRYDDTGDYFNNTFAGTGHHHIIYVHPYQYQWINNVYTKVYTADPYWKITSPTVDLAKSDTLIGTYTNMGANSIPTYSVS